MFIEIFISVLYFLILNFLSGNFFYDKINFEIGFTILNNQVLSGILSLLLIYIFHLFLLLLGRYFYNKLKEKKEDYGDIYFLAFVLRIFPILSLIASFLLGMNSQKLSKVVKVFTSGFILYTIVGYLIFKYFDITWMNIFGLF